LNFVDFFINLFYNEIESTYFRTSSNVGSVSGILIGSFLTNSSFLLATAFQLLARSLIPAAALASANLSATFSGSEVITASLSLVCQLLRRDLTLSAW